MGNRVKGDNDFIHCDDGSDVDELWISEKPATGESIEVQYLGTHDNLDDDTDVTTVPDRHLDLIVLSVRKTTYHELARSESADPDPTSLQSGTLELNAFRADRDYRKKLEMFLAAESESTVTPWGMDQYDRVY